MRIIKNVFYSDCDFCIFFFFTNRGDQQLYRNKEWNAKKPSNIYNVYANCKMFKLVFWVILSTSLAWRNFAGCITISETGHQLGELFIEQIPPLWFKLCNLAVYVLHMMYCNFSSKQKCISEFNTCSSPKSLQSIATTSEILMQDYVANNCVCL